MGTIRNNSFFSSYDGQRSDVLLGLVEQGAQIPDPQGFIGDCIAAQEAAEAAAAAAEAASQTPAYIGENGNWYTFDAQTEQYVDSGVHAQGEQGEQGADGADGVSPAVTIGTVAGGHSVTITDKDHPSGQSFDVMDGGMQASQYDPQGAVATAGGIPAYVSSHAPAGGVTSFNGRTGAVTPQSGDYTASDVEAVPVYGMGKNLLDNGYFVGGGSQQGDGQFPINQRGKLTYTGTGYSIDRWYIARSDVTVQLLDSGLNISTTSTAGAEVIKQRFQHSFWKQLAGKNVTISFLLTDGRFATESITLPIDTTITWDTAGPTIANYGYFDISGTASSDTCGVRFVISKNNTSATIAAVKLELGSEQTLAHNEGTEANPNWVLNDPPPKFQQELANCQRYYQIYATQSLRPSNAADCRPVMRITPAQGTISVGGTTYYYNDANL